MNDFFIFSTIPRLNIFNEKRGSDKKGRSLVFTILQCELDWSQHSNVLILFGHLQHIAVGSQSQQVGFNSQNLLLVPKKSGVHSEYNAGWDKIFYFVGANTFGQKFRPKQRESDATEDVQNSGNLGASSSDKKLLTVA